MKTKSIFVNLGLVCSMLFCLAFTCNNGDEERGGATSVSRNGTTSSSDLPAGKYSCFTTVQSYAGRGAGGFPIYNFSKQGRGAIDVKSNGAYTNPDGSNCRYLFDADSGEIQWLDCTFREATSSSLLTDDAGNPSIQIKFNGDKDVWDCGK